MSASQYLPLISRSPIPRSSLTPNFDKSTSWSAGPAPLPAGLLRTPTAPAPGATLPLAAGRCRGTALAFPFAFAAALPLALFGGMPSGQPTCRLYISLPPLLFRSLLSEPLGAVWPVVGRDWSLPPRQRRPVPTGVGWRSGDMSGPWRTGRRRSWGNGHQMDWSWLHRGLFFHTFLWFLFLNAFFLWRLCLNWGGKSFTFLPSPCGRRCLSLFLLTVLLLDGCLLGSFSPTTTGAAVTASFPVPVLVLLLPDWTWFTGRWCTGCSLVFLGFPFFPPWASISHLLLFLFFLSSISPLRSSPSIRSSVSSRWRRSWPGCVKYASVLGLDCKDLQAPCPLPPELLAHQRVGQSAPKPHQAQAHRARAESPLSQSIEGVGWHMLWAQNCSRRTTFRFYPRKRGNIYYISTVQ